MRFFVVIFVLSILCSCSSNRFIKEVEQFKGSKITIPTDLNTVWNGKDTVLTNFTKAPIKFVVLIDSHNCASCLVAKMSEWNNIVAYADSLQQWFNIIFLFSPKNIDLDRVEAAIKINRFDYPLFIDKTASFVKQNSKLPKNRRLHNFLLDKNNRVIMVGNPLYSPVLWSLYKKTIQELINNNGVLPEK